MKIEVDCIPCFLRQALNAAKIVAPDKADVHKDMIKIAYDIIINAPEGTPPPVISNVIQEMIENYSGSADPYAKIKKTNYNKAVKTVPYLKAYIGGANDPLLEAVNTAIMGNAIDMGANPDFNLEHEINKLSANKLNMEHYKRFKEDVRNAEYILYITDNMEEAVFDKLLIEKMLPKRIIFAVREKPVLNDITLGEANMMGIDKMCEVISSGSLIAGTDLASCNEKFLNYFHNAPVVIAKGQGNYETLDECGRSIYFMFKVKCAPVAKNTGRPVGEGILLRYSGKNMEKVI